MGSKYYLAFLLDIVSNINNLGKVLFSNCHIDWLKCSLDDNSNSQMLIDSEYNSNGAMARNRS